MSDPFKQQTAYPLLLALSVAFCLHVVVATLANAWVSLPVPNTRPPTVSVRIAPATGSVQTTPVKSSTKAAQQKVPAQDTTETRAPKAEAVTAGDQQRTPKATTSPTNAQQTTETAQADRNEQTDTTSPEDNATTSETSSPVSSQNPEVPITRLSQNDNRQRSAYEITLWERIAKAVAYTPLLKELGTPHEVVLELRLMRNGALRRAKVTTSSGIPDLDEVAREAALAATPFPDPPEGRRRFSVRLLFEPVQPD
ncbi:TonB family protein [Halomonadaceae bacterium KBTZ08]